MKPEELQKASFRGVPFLVSSASLTSGRRLVRKRFPNSNRQSLEDLGETPDEFTVQGVIAAQRNVAGEIITSYRGVRNALIRALKQKGPGVFVNPFLGKVESVGVMSFLLNEDMTRLGDATIDITFAVTDSNALPQPTESVVGSVSTKSSAVVTAVEKDVELRFKVTDTASGNFDDAVSKATDISDKVRDSVSVASAAVDTIDDFEKQIENYEDTIVDLVSDPEVMGEEVAGLVVSIRDLYPDVGDAFTSLTKLFGFGDSDTAILQTTAGRIERQRNREVLNTAVQATALSEAYLAAASLTFENTDEVDSTSEALEDQYQKIVASGELGDDVAEGLAELRVTVNTFFDQERDLRPQIVEVRTDLTSTRLLAFRFYGKSDRGDELARLNGFSDSSAIEGNVKVLSA